MRAINAGRFCELIFANRWWGSIGSLRFAGVLLILCGLATAAIARAHGALLQVVFKGWHLRVGLASEALQCLTVGPRPHLFRCLFDRHPAVL